MREMIKKGDPVVRVKLPEVVVRMLESAAKKNKRCIQDQFIKSLAETFKNEVEFSKASKKFMADLAVVYQSHQ